MANEILQKSRDTITAQANGALTADYYPGDGTDYSGSSAGACETIEHIQRIGKRQGCAFSRPGAGCDYRSGSEYRDG